MNEESNNKVEEIMSRDIYEIAFFLSKTACKIESIRFTEELNRPICYITISGKGLKSYQLAYLNSDAKANVDPITYRKNIGFVKSLVSSELKKGFREGGAP